MLIKKLRLAMLPASSVARQVTVVWPMENRLPERGEQATSGEGSMLSVALTLKVTTSPNRLVAVRVIVLGTVIVGAVTSSKRAETLLLAVRARVQAPVPEQSPPQPLKADPLPGLAVSVTVVPAG
jgi:hypothetical protein